ncbi:hypothetical protein FB451DRAFT_1170744 [Mycena latifolia]|nr:hypothetical protein FB451DRAFT_1170744 [Mycena latifolia]
MLLLKKSFVMIAVVLSVHLKAANAVELGASFCNDINWTNDCVYWGDLEAYTCLTLNAEHQDKVSSFGPTACALHLEFLAPQNNSDYHCGSSSTILEYPGTGDLRNVYYPPANGAQGTVLERPHELLHLFPGLKKRLGPREGDLDFWGQSLMYMRCE